MTVRRKSTANLKTRFTFFLTARQVDAIYGEASGCGISVGEILRRILDDWLQNRPKNEFPAVLPASRPHRISDK